MNVFLSGGIEGLTDEGRTWRFTATKLLEQLGYEVLNPCLYQDSNHTPYEIVKRNMHLQDKADLLLVEYMIPNRSYIGTDFEMTLAFMWNQPVVVWCCDAMRDRVYMRYLATHLTDRLEGAIDYIANHYPAKQDKEEQSNV